MNLNKESAKNLLLVLCGAAAFYAAVQHPSVAWAAVKSAVGVISPFLLGGSVAFVLNVPMRAIERHMFPKERQMDRLRRPLALIGALLAVIGLEDHFMGKLTGISMGCDCCYTNHMKADQNDIENLAALLTLAGCNYFMGIPHGDDIMLNYQTTGFRETATLRELTGTTAIPEFQQWLEKMGFVENGKLTAKAGDGSSLLF